MPIYEFVCESCSKKTERFTKDRDLTYTDCRFCGRRAKKIISPSSFVLEGITWSRDNYDTTPLKERNEEWSIKQRKKNLQPEPA